jgi:hypothetical protein
MRVSHPADIYIIFLVIVVFRGRVVVKRPRQGKARQGKARQGKARQGKARR